MSTTNSHPSRAAGHMPDKLSARDISVILTQKGLADSAGAFYDHATALSVGRAIAPTMARQLADTTAERDERRETVRYQAKKIDEQAAEIAGLKEQLADLRLGSAANRRKADQSDEQAARIEQLEKALGVAEDSLSAATQIAGDQRVQDSGWDGVRDAVKIGRAAARAALSGKAGGK